MHFWTNRAPIPTTGLVRLGISTEAARGKAQGQGRKLSQAIYDQTDAQGLIYNSRLTGRTCVCVYDRVLPGGLIATPVVEVMLLADFVDTLRELNVKLIGTPQPSVERDSTKLLAR